MATTADPRPTAKERAEQADRRRRWKVSSGTYDNTYEAWQAAEYQVTALCDRVDQLTQELETVRRDRDDAIASREREAKLAWQQARDFYRANEESQ